jgi:NADH-quinone oxidoreductase subunit L
MHNLIGLVVLIPFLGFVVNGLLGKKLKSEALIGTIGSATIGFSFLLSVLIFLEMLQSPGEERSHIVEYFRWVAAGSLDVSFAYQVDQLSIVMALIVTGVGFLIHVYSIGYMHKDPGFWRFFAYLNLFIFAMLTLVLANNFLLLFLGWEGVGLCSYLLIGFWHEKKFNGGTTSDAAKKAFIVNRVGDFGFLLGMFLVYKTFGSLNFDSVFPQASAFSVGNETVTWITLLLFLGAIGKSAQIPLYVWLPDAMAGPTPVSALIHAATMVTAGVYMVARCSILYALSPVTMAIVAVVGAGTAVFAASIGLVQNDMKKILAYSTISQLGYMFLALGVGAFSAGIFHLMTHAFFKALLFLGSGAVIHAMMGEQNIQKMGGLRSSLPITYRTFVIGALAISGIFPLSGFFSKDEILWRAFDQGSILLYLVGLGGAAMTAFYMFRLVTVTFEGERRWGGEIHPHEAPKVMTVPLIFLAALSVVGGVVGIPPSLGGHNALEHWLEPVFTAASDKLILFPTGEVHAGEYVLMGCSLAVAIGAILLARHLFLVRRDLAARLAARWSGLYQLLSNKYYVDEVYDAAVVTPLVKGSEKILWGRFDIGLIDGAVNGTAKLIGILSQFLRRIQTGVAQAYALVFVIGIILVLGWLIFM